MLDGGRLSKADGVAGKGISVDFSAVSVELVLIGGWSLSEADVVDPWGLCRDFPAISVDDNTPEQISVSGIGASGIDTCDFCFSVLTLPSGYTSVITSDDQSSVLVQSVGKPVEKVFTSESATGGFCGCILVELAFLGLSIVG